MGVGIELTCSKFVDDSKLHGAVSMLEGRDTIQRDLDGWEKWACVNFRKWSRAKC